MINFLRTTWSRILIIFSIVKVALATIWPFICAILEMLVSLAPNEDDKEIYSESEEFFASKAYIKVLRANIKEIGIITTEGFDKATDTELQKYYNGIGPECWSKRLRKKVSKYLRGIEESSLAHDFGTATVPRTYSSFTLLNVQLISNVIKESRTRKIKKVLWCGIALALICQLFGYSSFKEKKHSI